MSESLYTAQRYAWTLAKSLMVCVVLFKAGSVFNAIPTSEYDGDPANILTEYDPFGR
jgi:hypothetical protein